MFEAEWPKLYLEVQMSQKEREQRVLEQQRDLYERLASKESLDPDLREMYASQAEALGPRSPEQTPD